MFRFHAMSLASLMFMLLAAPVQAADGGGGSLSLIWVAPFAGILLSIALFPLVAPHFWHHHFGKIALFWALLFLIPFCISKGVFHAFEEVLHDRES